MKNSKSIKLWLIKNKKSLKPISQEEEEIACNLSPKIEYQFRHSRGYIREVLSILFRIPPLEIPLNASLGKPPELPKRFGFISFSHCNDSLLISWSQIPIGVDIERIDRSFPAIKLMDNFYTETEKKYIKTLNIKLQKQVILKLWNLKEAVIKLRKGSISNDLKKLVINSNFQDAFHESDKQKIKIHHILYEYWSLGIASNEVIKNPTICVYS